MKLNLTTAKDLRDLADKINSFISNLSLTDVLRGFKEDLVIKGGETVSIRNKLTIVPKSYIILSQEGVGQVIKGRSPENKDWNNTNLYLKNSGTAEVKITVIFLR